LIEELHFKDDNMKYCLIIALLCLLINRANSATIYVPTDYPSIQGGIDAATAGDTVVLEIGTYNEYDIRMKYGVHLLGETGNPEDVVINAPQNGSVIICENFEGVSPTTIEALTITSSADSNSCYGIWCENCPNIVIDNNIIHGNGNTGIISYDCGILIEDNRIYDNQHVSVSCMGDSSHVVIIRNNVIHDNRNMYSEGLGGGIHCASVRLELSGNLIYDNISGGGGGAFILWCKSVTAFNNTIVNNTAPDFAGGLMLILQSDDSAFVGNSILWGNSIDQIYPYADSGAYYEIEYCDIMGGWDGATNFSLDPEFCDTASGDFSIDVASPCAPENNGSGVLIGAGDVVVCESDVVDGDFRAIPAGLFLSQNHPNPFNASTMITYRIPSRSRVTICIYNLLGERVKTLIDTDNMPGIHTVFWDGTDYRGAAVSSGIYFYSIMAGELLQSKKMLLLK